MSQLKIEKHCPYLVQTKKPGGAIDENNGMSSCETGNEKVRSAVLSSWVMVCMGCKFYRSGFEVRKKVC